MQELFPSQQSGFQRNHSTEMLQVHLLSNLYGAINCGKVTLLALFDISAAFYSVEHPIFIKKECWRLNENAIVKFSE